MRQSSSGFTLIELLTIVAIVGVLSAYAITAYSGYTTRAKVAEIITIASSTKNNIAEACISNGRMPLTAGKAAISLNPDQSRYVSLIEYDTDADQVMATVRYTLEDVDDSVDGKGFELVGTCGTGAVNWDCLGDPGLDRLLPKAC